MADVVIIGAGVIGCAIARQLSRRSLECIVIEKNAEPAFGTTKANSGIVHAGHQSDPNTMKGRFDAKACLLFDELLDELHFSFKRIGELVIAQAPEDAEKLDKMREISRIKGVTVEMWDAATLREKEPSLSHEITQALHAPMAGVINPYEFTYALIENAMANGVQLRTHTAVTAIEKTATGLAVITENTVTGQMSRIETRFVVNAAGLYADKINNLVNEPYFTINPRKGQEFLLDRHITGQPKRLIFPLPTKESKGILLIPTYDGTLMIGPTAENTDFDDFATTPEGQAKIYASVQKICPNLGPMQPIAQFAGLRAVASTDDFIIEPTATKGFINVAGIQSPGLTASPEIARYVDEILTQEGLKTSPNPHFNPIRNHAPRFSLVPLEKQLEMVAENPNYADIICRCEVVPRAEIENALNEGATTLDGIKLRTRAGMGRCQGGFCSPRVLQMLADHLHCPLTAIHKNNDGSWIATPHK